MNDERVELVPKKNTFRTASKETWMKNNGIQGAGKRMEFSDSM